VTPPIGTVESEKLQQESGKAGGSERRTNIPEQSMVPGTESSKREGLQQEMGKTGSIERQTSIPEQSMVPGTEGLKREDSQQEAVKTGEGQWQTRDRKTQGTQSQDLVRSEVVKPPSVWWNEEDKGWYQDWGKLLEKQDWYKRDWKEPEQEKVTPGKPARTWGDIPEAKKFDKWAGEDWEKLNNRIKKVKKLLDSNRKNIAKLEKLRDELAQKAGKKAEDAKKKFTEGAVEEIKGQIGGDNYGYGTKILDAPGKSVGELAEDVAKFPTETLEFVGETMDDYQQAKMAEMDIEALDGLINKMWKLQQPLAEYYDKLVEQQENLRKKIEDTQKKMWSEDQSVRQQALDDYEKEHEKTEQLTGNKRLLVTEVVPGKSGGLPGTSDHYWDHSAQIYTLAPEN
jgi:hypothetical protein